MPWVVDEEKGIGYVEVAPEEEKPPKPPGTFLEEHERIKAEIDKAAKEAKCSSVEELAKHTGYSKETIREHGDVFLIDKYVVSPDGDYLCSGESIAKMRDKIKRWKGVD